MTDETIARKLATPSQRVRFVVDDTPDLSWLEQEEFADEDPDDFAVLGCVVETQCACCGSWHTTDSLWGITVYGYGGSHPVDEGLARLDLNKPMSRFSGESLPGYLGNVVTDMDWDAPISA